MSRTGHFHWYEDSLYAESVETGYCVGTSVVGLNRINYLTCRMSATLYTFAFHISMISVISEHYRGKLFSKIKVKPLATPLVTISAIENRPDERLEGHDWINLIFLAAFCIYFQPHTWSSPPGPQRSGYVHYCTSLATISDGRIVTPVTWLRLVEVNCE